MPRFTSSKSFGPLKVTDPVYASPLYTLLMEAGPGGDSKVRTYAGPDGFVYTYNAYWVEGSSEWRRDNTSNMAELWEYRPNWDTPFRVQRVLGGANPITWHNGHEAVDAVKAWANVLTAAGPSVGASKLSGVSLVSFPSSTVMRLTFQTAMQDTNYVVHGSVTGAAGLYVEAMTTTYVDVKFAYFSSGADVDLGTFIRNYMVSIVSAPYRALVA